MLLHALCSFALVLCSVCASSACEENCEDQSNSFLQLTTNLHEAQDVHIIDQKKTEQVEKTAQVLQQGLANFLNSGQKIEETSLIVPTLLLQLLILSVLALFVYFTRQADEEPPKAGALLEALQDAEKQPSLEKTSKLIPGVDAANDVGLTSAVTFAEILQKKALSAATQDQGFAHVWDLERGLSRTLSYAEFARAVLTGAEAMIKAGVAADSRVAFLAKGSTHFFVGVLSTQVVGAVPVLLNWRQPEHVLLGCITDTGAATIMKGAPYHEMGCKLADASKTIVQVLAFDDDKTSSASLSKPVTVWKWSSEAEADLTRLTQTGRARTDEAVIFFTSGSTGQPKPVLHTYDTLMWLSQRFIYPPDAQLSLSFLPNFHVIGTVQNFLIPLTRGLRMAIHGADETTGISSGMILAAAAALKPDVIDTVPFIMAEWSELTPEELKPLLHCKWVQSGGAPLATPVAERLMDAGVNARTHYGQTESPGIQLITIPAAKPSELSLFLPPWHCASVSLFDAETGNEDAQKGELIIKGTECSSPGYLKDGVLRPGSSKKDSRGRHSTSDVFEWVTASNGTRCLKHSNRTDDVILLSTGEMFNPIQLEASILNYGLKTCGLKVVRSVVLGDKRSAGFLVVELGEDEKTTAAAATELLQPGLDQANLDEAEYARIKKGHLLVLAPAHGDKPLPTSVKGNVVRKLAEVELSERLDEQGKAAQAAALDSVDWEELRRKAEAAGYSDFQQYLLENGAELGMDSLGLSSVVTASSQDMDRSTDNIYAWMSGTVLMMHWYQSPLLLMLVLDPPAALLCPSSYVYAIWIMYYALFTMARSSNGFTTAMFCFLYAVGWGEGSRATDGVKFFDDRTLAVMILLFVRKLVITPLMYVIFQDGCLAISNSWFWYAILLGKAVVVCYQYLTVPRALKVAAAFIPVIVVSLIVAADASKAGSTSSHVMTMSAQASSPAMATLMDALFDPWGYVNIASATCVLEATSAAQVNFRPLLGPFVYAVPGALADDEFYFGDWNVIAYTAPYVLGFLFGDDVRAFLKQRVSVLTAKGSANVETALAGCLFIMALALNLSYLLLWDTLAVPSTAVGAMWNLASTIMLGMLIIATCIVYPGRAQRMGSAALGLFIFNFVFPFLNCGWIQSLFFWSFQFYGKSTWLDALLAGTSGLMLVGWPYLYGYWFGPSLQWVTQQIIRVSMVPINKLKGTAKPTEQPKAEQPKGK